MHSGTYVHHDTLHKVPYITYFVSILHFVLTLSSYSFCIACWMCIPLSNHQTDISFCCIMLLCKGSLSGTPDTFFQMLSVWAHISSPADMTKLFTLKWLYRLFFVFGRKNFHLVGWQQAPGTAIVIGLVDGIKQIPRPHNLTHLRNRPVHPMRRVVCRPETDTWHTRLSCFTKYLPAVKPGPVLDTGTLRIINAHFLMV